VLEPAADKLVALGERALDRGRKLLRALGIGPKSRVAAGLVQRGKAPGWRKTARSWTVTTAGGLEPSGPR